MQHFRAAFEPIAREVILVDTGALCSESYTPELFDKVRRPVWPLDGFEFRNRAKRLLVLNLTVRSALEDPLIESRQ